MDEWIKALRIEDLVSPYDIIAQELGLNTAIEIERIFRGQQVYFPSFKKSNISRIRELILDEFNGYNYAKLAKKYDFTERYIRMLCKGYEEQAKRKPLDGQINMFE